MAKMGRPTDNPRTKSIQFRFSESEADLLQNCADRMGINRVDVIVKGIHLIDEQLRKEGKL